MSSKKRFSDEGIGRIWKSTLAQTVDSASARTKKDSAHSQRVHNHESSSRKILKDNVGNHDDLDAVNIQAALQNIRSLSACGQTSDGSFQKSDQEDNSSSSVSAIKNFVVKINNDNALDKTNDSSLDRLSKSEREVKETGDESQCNGKEPHFERGASHPMAGSKSFGGDRRHHMRRNDAMNYKRRDESRTVEVPPRFSNKKNDEMNQVDGSQNDGGKTDNDIREENDTVLNINREHETNVNSEQEQEKEIDALDKWKLKRQKASSAGCGSAFNRMRSHLIKASDEVKSGLKGQQDTPSKHGHSSMSSAQKITSFTVHSSKLLDCESKQAENIRNQAVHEIVNATLDSESDDGAGIHLSNDNLTDNISLENESVSHEEYSAMGKIQSLFQSYTSPQCVKESHQSDTYSNRKSDAVNKEDNMPVFSMTKSDEVKEVCSVQKNILDDYSCIDDGEIDDENVSKDMGMLQLVNNEQTCKSDRLSNKCDQIPLKKESFTDECISRLKSPAAAKIESLVKSPASVLSGFSSDYEVGVVSQSETEDDETPHPCASTLFPSDPPSTNLNEQQQENLVPKQGHDIPSSAPVPQMSGFYGHPQQQMPPYHQIPPWFHSPYYNYPYHHPMQPHPSQYPAHVPNPKDFTAKCTNKMIIPVERFNDDDTRKKVADFVATKKEEWDRFMKSRHGEAVPVEVVIKVSLAGISSENDEAAATGSTTRGAYPAQGPWPYPMYPHHNMGYNYNAFWPQPYGDETVADPIVHNTNVLNENQQMEEKEEEGGENVRERHPSSDAETVTKSARDSTGSPDLEDMKRRALSFEEGGHSDAGDRTTKKRVKSLNEFSDDSLNESKSQRNTSTEDSSTESTKCSNVKKILMGNSISSFLNPNDLKNDWKTPPKLLLSLQIPTTRQSKYDQGSDNHASQSEEKERDRSPHLSKFQHRSYRSKTSRSYDEDENKAEERDSTPTGESQSAKSGSTSQTFHNQGSVCVVERNGTPANKSDGKQQTQKRLSGEDYPLVTGQWAEICPEPESPGDGSLSSWSSPQADTSSAKDRRRSDSVVAYGHDDRYPMAKSFRLSRTPGMSGNRVGEELEAWKAPMMARSKTYQHDFIDTHCHIDFLYHRINMATIPFSRYIERNEDSFPVNYGGCVAVFCNPKVFSEHTQAYGILQLLMKEKNVWVAIGCHPKSATEFTTHHLLRLRRFLRDHPRAVALGEIGLDYSGTFHQHADIQKDVFIQQLRLALDLKLPLVIHCRDADEDCLDIMKKHVPVDYKIHLHCFTRRFSICREYMEHFPNLYVGFTPLITYGTAREATESAALVPLNRLLLETDAPYFLPFGVHTQQQDRSRKGLSHPGMALFTAERIAHLKNVDVDVVLEACRKNTRFVYGI